MSTFLWYGKFIAEILILNLVTQAPNTCVYLGIDADPSWNIAARIRGPNVS